MHIFHDDMVWGINDIRRSETSGEYNMIQHNMNVKYNRSDEWRCT